MMMFTRCCRIAGGWRECVRRGDKGSVAFWRAEVISRSFIKFRMRAVHVDRHITDGIDCLVGFCGHTLVSHIPVASSLSMLKTWGFQTKSMKYSSRDYRAFGGSSNSFRSECSKANESSVCGFPVGHCGDHSQMQHRAARGIARVR
jgi:hypothetical protein